MEHQLARRRPLARLMIVLCAAVLGLGALSAPAAAAGQDNAPAAGHAIGPVTKHTAKGTLVYGFQPADAGQVTTLSANGCSQNVCISIVGTSNYVVEWATTAYTAAAKCTWADFIGNNIVFLSADVVCGDGAGLFYWYWYPGRYFPSPTLACNRWFGISGYPCETIRK